MSKDQTNKNEVSVLHLTVKRSQKAAWVRKASSLQMKLGAWVCQVLDREAR